MCVDPAPPLLLPTGDPVEVNAASSILVSNQSRSRPLSLLASKSWHGHGEPAAGLIALAHAAEAAGLYQRAPLLHLGALNPFIEGVLDLMPEQTHGRGVIAARQTAPLAAGAEQQVLSSISSFAFMGTNSHILIKTRVSNNSDSSVLLPGAQELVWHRRRNWVAPPVSLLASRAVAAAAVGQVILQSDLSAVQLSYLWDHQVAGSVVFPGAGYFMAAAAAANTLLGSAAAGGSDVQLALQHATIPAPLVLPSIWELSSKAVPVLQVSLDLHSSSVSISSVSSSQASPAVTHFSSKLSSVHAAELLTAAATPTEAAAGALPAWLRVLVSSTAAAAAKAGQPSEPGATAAIAAASHNDGCGDLDVGVFDSWLQAGQVFILKDMAQSGVYVPASVDLVLLPTAGASSHSSSSSSMLAYVQPCQPAAASSSSRQAVSDYQLISPAGAVCTIKGMTAKPIASSKPASVAGAATAAAPAEPELLYEVQWQAVDAANAATEDVQGECAFSSSTEPAALAALQGLLQQQHQATLLGAVSAAVVAPAVDSGPDGCSMVSTSSTAQAAAAMMCCFDQEQPGMQLSVAQHSRYDINSLDGGSNDAVLLPGDSKAVSSDVFGSLSSAGVLLRPRLLPALAAAQVPSNFQLMPLTRGSLDSLTPVPISSWPDFSSHSSGSSSNQLLVKVAAVGINFRDVLNVLGMYPGDPGAPGSDFSGIVVSGPLAGSAVFGLSTGALASHVVASVQTVAPMPATVSFEAAATVPTVFTTADAALRQLAGLSAGEAILVHGAAGGVGLAAVQAAAAAGASVVATAGSSAKRHLLRSLGCKVAVGSRDTTFATDITLAGGVDVVLNSLTSPGMVGGSLAVLKQGGRFVEIGKRDIWAPAAVAGERPDVSYHMLAIDFMPPAVLQQLLLQVSADLAAGRVAPIRAAVHDIRAVHAAMRQMAQARHVGKVVVSAHAAHLLPSSSSAASSGGLAYNAATSTGSGSVLVTGGTGALGQLVTSWLATQQVQHIILCSRTGKLSGATLALSDPCHPLFNSVVTVSSCDVGAASDVSGLFDSIRCSSRSTALGRPALSAIMHAGGVLADAALANQTASGLRKVAAPKSVALQLLVQQLVSLPVVSNVLFSSMAALLGSAGQGNYAATNAALDAAARQLQGAGLCAASVQFSAWSGAGMAAATASKVDAMGIGALSPSAGLSALEAVVRSGLSVTR